MTTAAIIQARMGSKRFPGKVLAMLRGKPVLQHVIERAKVIPGIDLVIVTMPDDDSSEPINDLVFSLGVTPVWGPEDDVLWRYWKAADAYNASIIMRITADCPFLPPPICEGVLRLLQRDQLDYASNIFPDRTFPKGTDCEVFTWDCLDAAKQKVTSWYDKEHVTPWMQRTEAVNRGCLCNKIDRSAENWCVDYPGDIPRLEKIIAEDLAHEIKH